MSRSIRRVGRGQLAPRESRGANCGGPRRASTHPTGVALALVLLLAGCQQKMADQPYYRPLEPSAFFADGRSARPLVAGTIPRDRPPPASPLVTGLRPEAAAKLVAVPAAAPRGETPQPPPGGVTYDPADYVDAFPFRITADDLRRGQERFTIYCTPCHDPAGTGHGKIVERGYVRPPSYHTDHSRGFARWGREVSLRDVPVGYFFEVMTRGYGAMPSYAVQVTPEDRWRIAAYVRALQLSQHAPLNDLPPEERDAARKALGGTP
jgi:mono/diheme cytochrome c family protein